MEAGLIISIGSLALALIANIVSWVRTSHTDNLESSDLMVTLKTDMKYNAKQLDKIDTRLTSIEGKLDTTMERIAKNEQDMKAGFKQLDLLRDRVERLEQRVYETGHQ